MGARAVGPTAAISRSRPPVAVSPSLFYSGTKSSPAMPNKSSLVYVVVTVDSLGPHHHVEGCPLSKPAVPRLLPQTISKVLRILLGHKCSLLCQMLKTGAKKFNLFRKYLFTSALSVCVFFKFVSQFFQSYFGLPE